MGTIKDVEDEGSLKKAKTLQIIEKAEEEEDNNTESKAKMEEDKDDSQIKDKKEDDPCFSHIEWKLINTY